jgi:hypothetical protein
MRDRAKFLPLLLPLLAAVVLLVLFVRAMSHSEPRLAGTNSVPTESPVIQLAPRSRVCQQIDAPATAASIQFYVAPLKAKGPPLSMRLAKDGRTLATGRVAAGWNADTVRFHFPTLTEDSVESTVCVRNEGRSPARFVGLATGTPTSTLVDGKPEYAVIGAVFFRPGTSDVWSLLPTIAAREGVLKGSLSGGWSFWFAAFLVLLAGVTAVVLSLRGFSR